MLAHQFQHASGRIVLLGATGYTGRLTAHAMVARGLRPVLAGRDPSRVEELSNELDGLEHAQADIAQPDSLSCLVGAGDVLVTTVGPFMTWGNPVIEAAIGSGASYLDSNGEPTFTRRVFEHHGSAAATAGVAMLPAFGWECVLGNLAGALALREAGPAAVRVDTGYFYTGSTGASGGTRASLFAAMASPSFAYRSGQVQTVRGGDRGRTITIEGEDRRGVSLGGSEHFGLPRSFPQLREVNAYLGWFGNAPGWIARGMRAASGPWAVLLRVPGAKPLYRAVTHRLAAGSTGGPDAEARSRGGVHVVGIAYDSTGVELGRVHLAGAEGYEFTAAILAWGAEAVSMGRIRGRGALGPVEAFGIDELEQGCGEAGVTRV
jgi:short subunit dehydrogenase-like uncharacterized protein